MAGSKRKKGRGLGAKPEGKIVKLFVRWEDRVKIIKRQRGSERKYAWLKGYGLHVAARSRMDGQIRTGLADRQATLTSGPARPVVRGG